MGERTSWDRSFVLLAGMGSGNGWLATKQAIAENFSCTKRLKFAGMYGCSSTNQNRKHRSGPHNS